MGYSPWGRQEVDTTEQLTLSLSQVCHSFSSKGQVSFNFMTAVLSSVILKPKEIKFVTVRTLSPSICHEVMGLDAMIFIF